MDFSDHSVGNSPYSNDCNQIQCSGCSNCTPEACDQMERFQDVEVTKETISRWESEQSEYKRKLITEDTPDIMSMVNVYQSLSVNPADQEDREFYIGGVDISFTKDNNIDACSCLTVVRMSDLEIVYQRIEMIQLTQPYIPGYLAFREVTPVVDLYKKLASTAPHYLPHVVMVDGNGVLHPRGFGLACHLGVVLDVPTMGVAKTLITAQGIHDDDEHKKKKQTLTGSGDFFDLVSDTGIVMGRCLRTCDKAQNPIYISVGHRITLECATQICLKCCKYRIPEPVRKADIDSREYLRQNKTEPYEFVMKL